MSVGFSFRVDIRPYSGYDDPSLPIASWISQAGAVGNATGGIINLDFLFHLDLDPVVSELFNLEQISADVSTANDREGILNTLNMDNLAQNRPGSDQFWHITLTAAAGVTGFAAMKLEGSTQLPLWLGAPNRQEGDAGLRIRFPNIDLLLYAVTLQGYMWGPRSVLAPGGPRRPVGGLFGNG